MSYDASGTREKTLVVDDNGNYWLTLDFIEPGNVKEARFQILISYSCHDSVIEKYILDVAAECYRSDKYSHILLFLGQSHIYLKCLSDTTYIVLKGDSVDVREMAYTLYTVAEDFGIGLDKKEVDTIIHDLKKRGLM